MDNITIDRASSLTLDEARYIIGRKLIKIEAEEFDLTLIFEDGIKLKVSGASYDGSPLDVYVNVMAEG